MKVEAVAAQQLFPQGPGQAGFDQAGESRRADAAVVEAKPVEKVVEPQVDSVELLNRIKELTDNGAYSVRFEKNQDINDVVVKLVDSKTGDIIRQIPAEELLGLNKQLKDLRAVMISKQG
ncbi:flagellar protein FlaG [Geoalkalibacter halelectricus]|uniref:Flagellar protein FlaG n=1 Tax=Geoalkalibacter halelectricus TaxID=2847045 RepID=A0ABY5ZS74_9BACT|nr:flagellar protein FlaG [Geoalkalibacter halelectricus]MDO3377961.1 flagellar protein FlaG [Geoalkalibacter halelectricus]UWZ81536.1 flagellar protein FlaG [Geoalkalibacter halelectricus]